ncbi:MAG: hypothetical protein GC168_13040 [Candidatus Hydrogenedens sp.]|nr:hypothetical protein [Candidatus Hydrogenedens sp.]
MPLFWMAFLFAGAAAMIILEFVLPGGILGVFGVLFLIGSTVVGVTNFPDLALVIILGEFIGGIGIFLTGMYVLSTVGARGPLFLTDSMDSEAGWENMKTDAGLVGKAGVVVTALRPAGIVEIDGARLDVTSDGAIIDPGEPVRVVRVSGNYIVVERALAPEGEIQTAE